MEGEREGLSSLSCVLWRIWKHKMVEQEKVGSDMNYLILKRIWNTRWYETICFDHSY